jgi:hypothetical protein
MDDNNLLDRREFTLQSALAILSAATITISGCGGGGDDSPSPGPSPSPNPGTNVTGNVSANHGHVATITAAQLTAGNAIQLDIRGTGDHPHTVELTAAEVSQIAARQTVAKNSTTEAAHSHTVTFN